MGDKWTKREDFCPPVAVSRMISVPAVAPSLSDTEYSALLNTGGLSFTSPIVITAATLELLWGTPRSDTTTVRL